MPHTEVAEDAEVRAEPVPGTPSKDWFTHVHRYSLKFTDIHPIQKKII